MKYRKILNKIQSETGLESPQERREILITAMRENERKGNDSFCPMIKRLAMR